MKCIDYLEQLGIETVGIFRIPGTADEVQALRLSLDGDANSGITDPAAGFDIYTCQNPHSVASVLKLFVCVTPPDLVP